MQKNPYNLKFGVCGLTAEIIGVDPGGAIGKAAFQLIIYGPGPFGDRTVSDIKEQTVALPEEVRGFDDALFEGWARVVEEILNGPDAASMMPADFFRGMRSASELKSASCADDYERAFRVKSRLGRWAMVPVTPPPVELDEPGPTDAELSAIEAAPEPLGMDFPTLAALGEVLGLQPPPQLETAYPASRRGQVPLNLPPPAEEFSGPLRFNPETGNLEGLEPPRVCASCGCEYEIDGHGYEECLDLEPRPTPAERLAALQAKLEGLPRGIPNRAKKASQLARAVRRLGRKLTAQQAS